MCSCSLKNALHYAHRSCANKRARTERTVARTATPLSRRQRHADVGISVARSETPQKNRSEKSSSPNSRIFMQIHSRGRARAPPRLLSSDALSAFASVYLTRVASHRVVLSPSSRLLSACWSVRTARN